jgi:hypothetical protein
LQPDTLSAAWFILFSLDGIVRMNEADEAELHRLCGELEQIDRQHLSPSQREALKKSALALSTAFAHALRHDIERQYATLGQPLTEEERQRMKSLGIDPG